MQFQKKGLKIELVLKTSFSIFYFSKKLEKSINLQIFRVFLSCNYKYKESILRINLLETIMLQLHSLYLILSIIYCHLLSVS